MMNQKGMNIKIKRIDLCDLLIACTSAYERSGAEKWAVLHNKLKEQLEEFDKKNGF